MAKKDWGFYTTGIILILGFSAIGANIYNRNMPYFINLYEYPEEGTFIRETKEITEDFREKYTEIWEYQLEGNTEYTFHIYVSGSQFTYAEFNIIFTQHENLSYEINPRPKLSTWRTGSRRNDYYFPPTFLQENETFRLVIIRYMDPDQNITAHLKIYQDLPQILLIDVVFIIPIVAIAIVIWMIAFDKYQKVFKNQEEENGGS
jgi:hypothetical protein